MLESGFLDCCLHFDKTRWWINLSEKNHGKASLEALKSHFCPMQDFFQFWAKPLTTCNHIIIPRMKLGRNPKNRFLTKFYFCFNSKMCRFESWETVWSQFFLRWFWSKFVKIRQILKYQLVLELKPLKGRFLRFCISSLSHG